MTRDILNPEHPYTSPTFPINGEATRLRLALERIAEHPAAIRPIVEIAREALGQ